MASRELSDDEQSKGVKPVVIAKDAIALIVNKNNETDNITMDNIKAIYTGEKTAWADVK